MLKNSPRLGRVVVLVLREGEPVACPGGIRRASERVVQLRSFGGWPNRLATASQPAQRLGSASQQVGAAASILPHRFEQRVVSVQCLLRLTGGKKEIGFEASGGRPLLGDEIGNRYAEAIAEEGKRCHRWLGQATLQSADVGRRVATSRQRRLGQSSANASLPNPFADAPRDVAVVDHDYPASSGFRLPHSETIDPVYK